MMKKVAVVIPLYKDSLSNYEDIALNQCQAILGNHPRIIVKPNSLVIPEELFSSSFSIINFDDSYFKSIEDYNRLMMLSEFYKAFLDFEYILIYQLDAFVFKDDLTYWCAKGFDYIGAPWIRKTYDKSWFGLLWLKTRVLVKKHFWGSSLKVKRKYVIEDKVGNGGFSLRKVAKFHNLCTEMAEHINFYLTQNSHYFNEDVFWSIEVNRKQEKLKIPSLQEGLRFAFEVPPVKAKQLTTNNLPFGCHDWDKYADYWRPVFDDLGIKI